jgi:hypothetical protein
MSQAVRALGYEIRREGEDVHLLDRGAWPWIHSTTVFWSSAALCAIVGLLIRAGVVTSAKVSSSFLFAAAVGLGALPVFMRIMFMRPRNLPPPGDSAELVIDPQAGELRRSQGELVAQLESVRAVARIDWWWTWGLTQLVLLSWEGGHRVVFRSTSRRKAQAVLKMLADIGIRVA